MRRVISCELLVVSFFLAAFCAIAFAADDGVAVRALVDKNPVLIGDRVTYTIEVKAAKDLDIEFPKFSEGLIGDFEIKDSERKTTKSFWSGRLYYSRYQISVYSTGKHLIPSFEIRYKKKGTKDWSVKKTGEINMVVESVLPKNKKVDDIKDIKGVIGFGGMKGLYTVILALAAIAAYLLVRFRRKKGPVRLPHETALEELEAVRGRFATGGDVKEYYVGISDCVRRYIEARFKFRAPEMTTEEFLDSLKESGVLSEDQKGLLKEFLKACDLVKFAKYAPDRDEAGSVFLTAKKFVEETKEDVRI